MRVLGISGSLREGSHNTELLRAAAKLLPPGTQMELFEGLADIPPYSEDAEREPPQAVTDLKDAIAAADVVLFSTPEYNHSTAGTAQERAGLGLAALRRQPAERQAGGRARREHGHVRRGVGAGRAAEGRRGAGRAGDRPRVPARQRRRCVHGSTASWWTPGSGRSWRTLRASSAGQLVAA